MKRLTCRSRFISMATGWGMCARRRTKAILTVAAVARVLLAPDAAVAQCCGDCNGDGQVTVDELVTAVNRALNGCQDDGVCNASVTTCSSQLTQCQGALSTCQSQSSGQRFPATGQATCWDVNGTAITCPGTGQDGEIQAGAALAYIDNGDGTITDSNTGLMWEKLSSDGSIHDYATTYTWDDAFAVKVATLNGTNFAGHTDWRVPNYKELLSILNLGTFTPAVSPAFNTGCQPGCTSSSCSCTQSDIYLSATTCQRLPIYAWVVFFDDGGIGAYGKTNSYYVRAVRGGL
jgi:hypothetical protein